MAAAGFRDQEPSWRSTDTRNGGLRSADAHGKPMKKRLASTYSHLMGFGDSEIAVP
ncbi:MAG: hypothetical protein V4689_10350 [Verrucomicrobiota bacterium]